MRQTILVLLVSGLTFFSATSSTAKVLSIQSQNESELSGTVRKTFNVKDFKEISCSGMMKIEFTQKRGYSVVAEINEERQDILKSLDVNVLNGKLTIKHDDIKKRNMENNGKYSLVIYVQAPSLNKLDIGGITTFETRQLNVNNIAMNISGIGNVTFDEINCSTFKSNISGIGNVNGKLIAKNVSLDASGKGEINLDVKADNLRCSSGGIVKMDLSFDGGDLNISNSGASEFNVKVKSRKLTASNSGIGKIKISGTADETSINNSGMSKIDVSGLNRF